PAAPTPWAEETVERTLFSVPCNDRKLDGRRFGQPTRRSITAWLRRASQLSLPTRASGAGERAMGARRTRPRPTEQITLAVIDSERAQRLRLLLRLDHLGHRADAEIPAQPHHRLDDRAVAIDREHPLNIGAIDLDEIHRQRLQIGEGRGAGPEIVEADLVPVAAKSLQQAFGAVEIVDPAGLGDLEHQL